MKLVVKFKSPKKHYKADACVVWCFDDRFDELFYQVKKFFGWKYVDRINIAGGAMGLTGRGSGGTDEHINYIANQVEKSIKLHQPSIVVIVVHRKCRAYKAIGLPIKGESETELLQDDLDLSKRTLAEYLEKKSYKPKIKKCLADFDGLWEVE